MKLYFSPGACSLSPHIILREAGLDHSIEKVNLRTKTTASKADYKTINPKGAVPALQLDDGSVLTEGPAIVQFLADLAPAKQLAPAAGTIERYRLMEILNYIGTELHKGYSPLFDPAMTDAARGASVAALQPKFEFISKKLGDADYLSGKQFTVADAYLFVVLSWSALVNVSLANWPNIVAFQARVAARPAVQAAMAAEGLIK